MSYNILFIFLLLTFTYVYCVSEMSEETCETLPSDIHLTKGTSQQK